MWGTASLEGKTEEVWKGPKVGKGVAAADDSKVVVDRKNAEAVPSFSAEALQGSFQKVGGGITRKKHYFVFDSEQFFYFVTRQARKMRGAFSHLSGEVVDGVFRFFGEQLVVDELPNSVIGGPYGVTGGQADNNRKEKEVSLQLCSPVAEKAILSHRQNEGK
jgi:hypothetical protein